MNRKMLFLMVVLFFSIITYSQKPKNLSIGLEISSNTVSGELDNRWAVRQDVGNYSAYSDYGNNSVNATANFYSVGIKPEISFFNNRLGIMSGLRFTNFNSYLGKIGFSDHDFFYLRYAATDGRTDYARVKNVNENVNYIGIPLEVRVYPLYLQSWGIYLKLGSELSFKVYSKTDLEFNNSEMENYETDILNNFDVSHGSILSTLYGSVGIRIGRPGQINYNLEASLPSFLLSKDNSSIVKPAFYNGVQFTVQFPIGKRVTQNDTHRYDPNRMIKQ